MSQMPDSYWINEEMKELELRDKRLEERTRKILYDFSQHPTGSIPQFCSDRAAVKGVYGYCRNKGVEREAIVAAQRQATLARIEAGGVSAYFIGARHDRIQLQSSSEYDWIGAAG